MILNQTCYGPDTFMKKSIINKSSKKLYAVITVWTSYTKMKSILIELKKNKNNKIYLLCAVSAVSNNYGNLENLIIPFFKNKKIMINGKT